MLEEFELLPGVADAVRRLRAAGFPLVVVTNQPDVARGTQTREGVEAINEHLRAELPILDVLACYHDSGDDCACRKPKPGMLLEAARRWRLDLRRSFLVGDRWSDVIAGQAAGCRASWSRRRTAADAVPARSLRPRPGRGGGLDS